MLREPSDAAPGSEPDAGPTALEGLVDRAAAAGLDVRLRVEGQPASGDALSAVERAVWRVVQEALTNVAKHAPGHRATVLVRHLDARTEVNVTNEPVPTTAATRHDRALRPTPGPRPDAPGENHRFGLIGLDERVRLAGGTFTSGPQGPEGGGFAVRATFPHRPGAVPPPRRTEPGEPAGALPPEHRSARRRLGRTAAAAVLVPLCTTALLIGGVRAWDTVTARQSVLAPRDYAHLYVGQPRADVAPYLPERQTTRRPAAPAPAPHDAVCEFYVQTGDPFDDRSGDIYRLCFRADRLVSTDDYTGKAVR
ncbi:sensor histidine kinase [Streptomyces sp. NPDC001513]|uniref:sensor histidine kinase n=1 Tax=Streptomyces sp. NPDC001513 TaxID=3364580 RepID=UPI0036B3D2BA